MDNEHFMHRVLQLARNGASTVAPNPMVGAVLVQGDTILAEGWHKAYGGPHAEVECLRAFGDAPIPEDAVMFVNLEPCSHHGKTPPCVDLLIARGVKHLVIGHTDPNPVVSGKGLARAREGGIDVTVGVLEDECRWLNRRFLSSFEQQRPYVILKWARSSDGFLDRHPRGERGVQRITSPATDVLVHQWRSEEQAILVGSRTVINDDPQLTVRHVAGRSPLRVVIDRETLVPITSHVFDGSAETLILARATATRPNAEVLSIGEGEPIDALLAALQKRNIRSVMIEGGAELLSHFLRRDLWDEARVLTGQVEFERGTPAPRIGTSPVRTSMIDGDRLELFTRETIPPASWSW